MNLKNLLTKLSLTFVLLLFVVANTFAATIYVSNTNGNDIVGTGTALAPYKTIAKALTVAADGDVIMIDADTYNEANVNITKSVTLVSQAFNALQTVTITNGVNINGAAKTVNLGTSASGSLNFNLGSTNTALVLTAGTLNITQAKVTIASGGRITRTAATINETPTTTNVSVFYTPGASISAGPELPLSLGTGSLNITAGAFAVTFANNLALSSGQIVVVSGDATFNGTVSFTSDGPNATGVDNQGAGTVAFANTINGARATAGGAQTTVLQNAGGVLTLTGGVSGTSTFTFGLTNGAGTINVGAGTYGGIIANNTNLGTLNLLGAVTFSNNTVGNGNAGAVIKLNGFQLTLSGAGATYTNTGHMISSTASTVGSGMLNITGVVTTTGTGQLPNVTVGGKLTLGANTSVYGDVTLNSSTAGAITDGGFVLTVYGSQFNRTNNTPGNYTATGGLTFASSTAQSLNPGASLVLNNVTINKGSGSILTLSASFEATGNLTITAGSLDVGNFNLNLTGSNKIFDNSGNAYSSTGVGYVVFQNADAGGVGTVGVTGTIQGTGNFGNILVNLVDPQDYVTTGASVTLSGTLYIYNGWVRIANGHTITFNSALVTNPTIKILTTGGTQGIAKVTGAGTGTVLYSVNVNLEYTGTAAYNVNTVSFNGAADPGGLEWTVQPLKLNNVSINATNTVTGFAGASTIAGTLTVVSGGTLAQGAFVYTLSGDSKTHSIAGTVTGGTLLVTGNGSAVNGSSSATPAATLNNLSFEPAANGYSFTSTNLKVIGGSLTLQGVSTFTGATATVTMNATNSTLTGNLNVGNATLGPIASVTINGSTTSVLTGNVALTNGTLTLTRGGNSTVIGGTVTATAGSLVLGSNVQVTGQTSQVDGNINAGGFEFIQLGSVATPDYNRTGVGTFTNGTLTLTSTAGAIDLTPGATFTVPALKANGTANGVTINAAMTTGTLTLDNAATFTQTGVLTATGNVTVTNDAGAFTGALTLTGTAATLTLGQNYAIPTLVINSGGTVTLATSIAGPTAATLTVGTAFTNTAGTLATTINHLTITGTYTFTAGAITQTSGILTWNTAGAVTLPASGFSVDNLTLLAGANTGTSAFTVVKALVLSGTLTTSADGKLTLGDGVLVTRTDNAATLTKIPTFGANTDLKYQTYTGAVVINVGKEAPATIRNLTVVAGASNVATAANMTITGTLSLAALLDVTTAAPDAVITMADGSTLELKANGTTVLDANLVKAGAMTLIYNGATATSTRELGAVTSGAYAAYAGNVTVKATVALTGGTLVLNGTLTFDGGNWDINGNATGIGGNVTTTANGGTFVNGGAAANLSFVGAVDQTWALGATWAVPAAINLRIAKTNATNTVTFTGGDLDFATNSATLFFVNGIFVTGTRNVVLKQTNAGGQPTQGFNRAGVTGTNVSHVLGNVKKFLTVIGNANAAVDLTRVEFPTGTATAYRPMAFQFNTLPTASLNLTVNHVAASPDGSNGFPIASGSISLANYPGFYWLVTSDLTLQPQVKYDIEAEAYGYGSTNYPEGIQNVRFLRRFDTDITNPWLLQGGLGYDNSTNVDHAKIIVRSAEGAISTQGARFTYSQAAKAPTVTTASATVATTEMVATTITWTKATLNIGGAPTFGTPQWTATAPAVVPTNATFNTTTGVLTWTPTYTQAGTYTVTVTATEGTLSTSNTVTITVADANQPPVFAVDGTFTTKNAKYNQAFSFSFKATDADAQTLTYSLVSVTPASAAAGTSIPKIETSFGQGLFTWTPVLADNGKAFVVVIQVTDGITPVQTTVTINVTAGYDKGDVTLGGGITIADALAILKHVVNNPLLSAEAQLYADVNTDGQITAYDASWILYYVANNNTWPLSKKIAAAGSIELGNASLNDGLLSLPLSVSLTKGVVSVSAEADFYGSDVEIKGITSKLPSDWAYATSIENGKVRFAAAGITPLTDGDIATINVGIKNKESVVTVSGNAVLNNEIFAALNSKIREIPTEFALSQNYPNPFNPTTTIKFSAAVKTNVNLIVYDMLGRVVKTLVSGEQEAGFYSVNWDGTNDFGSKVSSGIYIYRLQAGNFVKTVKMNLMK